VTDVLAFLAAVFSSSLKPVLALQEGFARATLVCFLGAEHDADGISSLAAIVFLVCFWGLLLSSTSFPAS